MKNWLSIFVVLTTLLGCSARENENAEMDSNRVVLAYVTSWSQIMPDPAYVTHVNYAFGHVNDGFNGVRIDNEERLKSIVALKRESPSLKVLLSIGGWGSGRFSEMAADDINRQSFAADCGRVVEQFGLDGIDMDWEYPTNSSANISSSPDDTRNFTLLMQDIRKVIGPEKLLTFASAANARYVDFKAVEPYVNFVNIMTYDMARPPFHHAGLYRSPFTQHHSVEESVDLHVNAGIPADKLTLGIPFYGRGSHAVPNFIDYKDIIKLTDYTTHWDDVAKAPYLTDKDDTLVCTYETSRSIAYKCAFLHEKGMLGAMYWDYNGDDEVGTLRKAVYKGVTGD
jgi:chitinase